MSVDCGHQRACCSSLRWYMSMERHGGMIVIGENQRTQRKACPNATLSTTNPKLIDPGVNPGLRGERLQLTSWVKAWPIFTFGLLLFYKLLVSVTPVLLIKAYAYCLLCTGVRSMHCRHASIWQSTLPHIVPTDAIPPCNMRDTYRWSHRSHHGEQNLHIYFAWHIIALTFHLMFLFWLELFLFTMCSAS
jgi:hypothetical protein